MTSDSTTKSALARDLTTVPNLLSLSRVVLTPLAVLALVRGWSDIVLWALVVSAIVDALDGYLARKLDQVTELGAILDRATDLMMESVAIFAVAMYGIVPFWVLFVYLFREFIVTSARMYMAEIGAEIPQSSLGKRKTNFLAAGFGCTFGPVIEAVPLGALSQPIYYFGYACLVAGLVASYLSMGQYLAAFARGYRR